MMWSVVTLCKFALMVVALYTTLFRVVDWLVLECMDTVHFRSCPRSSRADKLEEINSDPVKVNSENIILLGHVSICC